MQYYDYPGTSGKEVMCVCVSVCKISQSYERILKKFLEARGVAQIPIN